MSAWTGLAPGTQVALTLYAIALASVLIASAVIIRAYHREVSPSEASEWDLRDPGMVWDDCYERQCACTLWPSDAGRLICLPDGSTGLLTQVVPWAPSRPLVSLTVAGVVHRVPGHATVYLGGRARPDDEGHLARRGWGT